ncbi:TPA: YdiL family protein [Citrobacter freundii]
MNRYELQALRHVFALSIAECVNWIAPDYTAAAWQQWETGEKEIPPAVAEKLLDMRQKRKSRILAIIDKINNRIGNNTMRFFDNFAAFQSVYQNGDFLEWKIYQSAAAELYAHDLERLC